MNRPPVRYYRLSLAAILVVLFVLLEGCYYMQAVGGQMELLRKRRPVAEVIDDEATDETLRDQLRMVQDARQFAVDELLLPENGSYQSYADLQRDFVVWNVFAALEFSLIPKEWCYPIAGCVAYRGYFSKESAHNKSTRLASSGFDVFVGGVAAYSTLGRFDDPLLNTMMHWSDEVLIRTLFHELAHQKLYVKGDTAFNESFASAVAEIGLRRWGTRRNMRQDEDDNDRRLLLQEDVRKLVASTRDELTVLYASKVGESEMRAQKKTLLDSLSIATQATIDASGVNVRNWLAAPLNNARLVSLGLYEGSLPAFREIFSDCVQQLSCFYTRSAELAALDFEQRQKLLRPSGGNTGT